MKVLNLVDLEKSDIKYKISKFPDGQQNIVINKTKTWDLYQLDYRNIEIKSRLNNFLDLELIICSVASLRELGVQNIHLYVPYIVGARSDRKFEEGGNNYLKDVICPIINSLNLKSVTCLDPHSDCLEMGIKNFKKQNNYEFVKQALIQINNKSQDNIVFISPDAGASKKIEKVAEHVYFKGDIITCSKQRDVNGKLTKTIVPMQPNHTTKDLIIIDDICDGGATFINIAKAIDEFNQSYKSVYGKKHLIVTHGIFSKGFEELSKCFDEIYCTNSYSNIDNNLIKQLNIF